MLCLHFWEVFSLDIEFWVARSIKDVSHCSSPHHFWWDVRSHLNVLVPYVKHIIFIWLLSTFLSFYFAFRIYYEPIMNLCMCIWLWRDVYSVYGLLSSNHYIYVFLLNLGKFCPLFLPRFFFLLHSFFYFPGSPVIPTYNWVYLMISHKSLRLFIFSIFLSVLQIRLFI